MALELQVGFLGPEHQYVATVTRISASNTPLGKSEHEFFGLPVIFCSEYKKRLNGLRDGPRYIYDVRGHDFLSFVGQWTSPENDDSGPLPTNETLYNEIAELKDLADKDERKAEKRRKANVIAGFGPDPGAFFANAFRLKEYHWQNLPDDLMREIRSKMKWGYGKADIWDVAVNALGGWVMQFDEGAQYMTGGKLPEELTKALRDGKERKGVSIERLFLNHQHPTEYVLAFNDGVVYASLHEEFEVQLRGLLEPWSKEKREDFDTSLARIASKFVGRMLKPKSNKPTTERRPHWWNFVASSKSEEPERRHRIAFYYNRRGVFYQMRGHLKLEEGDSEPALHLFEIARAYLRQANTEDSEHLSIQVNYVSVLKAIRMIRFDPILETILSSDFTLSRRDTVLSVSGTGEDPRVTAFRSGYLLALTMLRDFNSDTSKRLAHQLQKRSMPAVDMEFARRQGEWSYKQSIDQPLGVSELDVDDEPRILDAGSQQSRTIGMPVELP